MSLKSSRSLPRILKDLKIDVHVCFICSSGIFSKDHLHSTRDEMTANISKVDLKIDNVVNTCCPTLWFLLDDNRKFRTSKGDKCIFSLTDYRKNVSEDSKFIDILKNKYGADNLLFWPQGLLDENYVKDLGYEGEIIQRDLQCLINIFSSIGLIPTKGMTLPFVSYGGSSMISIALLFGFLLSLIAMLSIK